MDSSTISGGAIFSKEETLLRIESTDYEIDLKSAQSGLKELQNRVLELDKQEKQTVEMLELDQQSLTLALKEFERQSALEEKGSTTQTVKDQAHQAYLSVKTRLKQKENQLETIPVQREALMAKSEQQELTIRKLERIVEKTSFRLPFEGRIRKSNLVVGQFVKVGQILFEADGTSRVELHSQISPRNMKVLLGGKEHQIRWSGTNMGNLVARLQWKSEMKFVGTKFPYRWKANLNRIDGVVDPTTRTLGIVFTVEEPWENLILGEKPPLIVGAHVEIDITGLHHDEVILVPRSAIHNSTLYLCNEKSQLEILKLEPDFVHQDQAIFTNNKLESSRLILTDLYPAIKTQSLLCEDKS